MQLPAPIQLAHDIADRANESCKSGELFEGVTETTRTLLTFWFDERYNSQRNINFHEGQRQAILDVIYLHEILKIDNVQGMYEAVAPHLLGEQDSALSELARDKYGYPKYCVKMATGTGKTLVLSALLIWQYLNAKHEEGLWTKNFLIIAPGLIVYERLLDAFLGKQREDDGTRDFAQSDISGLSELLLPDEFKDEVFGFFHTATTPKEEIGRRSTGEGIVAVTNWHALVEEEEELEAGVEVPGDVKPHQVVQELLPARPGTSAGNDLNTLDRSLERGRIISYFKALPDLVVFNDEAHHLGLTKSREDSEKKWQQSINSIARKKEARFLQVDFSATPYVEKGKGVQYFPHLTVDFDLKTAIRQGLVKMLVLDKRSEIASRPDDELDFRAIRDENGHVTGLSDGQRVMLRAGLTKLKRLEAEFVGFAPDLKKHPKMMVVCEDTSVVPFVSEFLKGEGLAEEDVLEIHSNKEGEVSKDEWLRIKKQLFLLDRHAAPKVVVSVLMLREGFDVNNICVIVPLRATTAKILLEQTIGRGLRQMWREPEFADIKRENRKRILDEHRSPGNYIDILSIVEHPAFFAFYEELMKGYFAVEEDEDEGKTSTGDMLNVPLREGYKPYDFSIPFVLRDSEEVIRQPEYHIEEMATLPMTIEEVVRITGKGDKFISVEVTAGTRFDPYVVSGDLFPANSYNDYIRRIVERVGAVLGEPLSARHFKKDKKYPVVQIKQAETAALVDTYIRTRLFGQTFNPFAEEQWRMLFLSNVTEHILREVSKAVTQLQETEVVGEPEVIQRKISEVESLRMRESLSFVTSKTIYERTGYPGHGGGLEKAFSEWADTDATVEAFVKLDVNKHYFVRSRYFSEEGTIRYYYPDFLVRSTDANTYIVETKADDQTTHPNVQRKQSAALAWCERINALPPEHRSNTIWKYVIVPESTCYEWKERGGMMKEMLNYLWQAEFGKRQTGKSMNTLFE